MASVQRIRKNWKTVIHFAVSLALLCVALWQVDWQNLESVFQTVSVPTFLASYLVFWVSGYLLSYRLATLLRDSELETSTTSLYLIWLRTTFYCLFMPADFGAAIARWFMVTRNRTGRQFFAVVTCIERLMLLTVAIAIVLVPLSTSPITQVAEFAAVAVPILLLLLVLCLACWALFIPAVSRRVQKLPSALAQRSGPMWVNKIFSLYQHIDFYSQRPLHLVKGLFLQIAIQALLVLRVFLLLVAVGVNMPVDSILCIATLVILITSVPVSLAGIGVREASFAWLVSLYGVPAEVGIAVGALVTFQFLLTAVAGGFVNLTTQVESELEPSGQSSEPTTK